MTFVLKNSLKNALKSSVTILKLIVPIYIIADVLFYYNLFSYITFLFEPITALLSLPEEAALSIVSGMFLNLYAAIAFAAPLGLGPKEWTILAVFLGIAHALVVETAVMSKIGISKTYSIILRLSAGLFVGFIVSVLPNGWFESEVINNAQVATPPNYASVIDLLLHSSYNALYLSVQIILLVSLLIFILDFIKSLKIIEEYSNKVNSAFSISVGVVLGITYGAGILINEYEKNRLTKTEILYIGTFLMVCHAIIEDTLLFVIFGANPWVIVTLRVVFALALAALITKYKKAKE